MFEEPAKTVYDELITPARILLGPGPSEANPRVLKAMTTPMLGYLDTNFVRLMDDTVAMIREVYGTENRLTLPVSGTGTAGMEAALTNVIEPGDGVVIGVNGYFGERLTEIATRCGGVVTQVAADWGTHVPAARLADAAAQVPNLKLVALVHGETSTGVLQPLEEAAEIAHRNGALFLADCVTTLGGQPIEMDARGIDIAYSCTQKCIACPPGLSPVSFSERAVETIRNRKTPIRSFYLDMTLLENYWHGTQRRYHHTLSMSLVYALREGLRIVLEEGLDARYKRHERNAAALLAGAAAIGLEPAAESGYRMPMLTTFRIPDGIDDASIRNRLLTEEGIEIGAGFGVFAGKVWRVGLMGDSANERNVLLLLSVLERYLSESGYTVERGSAVHAASQVYSAA